MMDKIRKAHITYFFASSKIKYWYSPYKILVKNSETNKN